MRNISFRPYLTTILLHRETAHTHTRARACAIDTHNCQTMGGGGEQASEGVDPKEQKKWEAYKVIAKDDSEEKVGGVAPKKEHKKKTPAAAAAGDAAAAAAVPAKPVIEFVLAPATHAAEPEKDRGERRGGGDRRGGGKDSGSRGAKAAGGSAPVKRNPPSSDFPLSVSAWDSRCKSIQAKQRLLRPWTTAISPASRRLEEAKLERLQVHEKEKK